MITLTTDFGDSEYVGAMKGAIYSLNQDALIVDLTHHIKPFNILHAAYAIYSTFPYLPTGTTHVVVVDPGVGTKRKALILESGGHFFVGPDNGVFSLLEPETIFEIKEKNASTTFHGRDIFAPIAAMLDGGKVPSELGKEVKTFKRIMKKNVEFSEGIKGEVFCVDSFGNIITSIRKEHLSKYEMNKNGTLYLKIGGEKISLPFSSTYGDVEKGEFIGLINSSGHFEISIGEESAGDKLKVRGGESVEILK
jgi:S-adenosylmethionine hydrolase